MPITRLPVSRGNHRRPSCTICGGPGVLQATADTRRVTLCEACFDRFSSSPAFSAWVREAEAAARIPSDWRDL